MSQFLQFFATNSTTGKILTPSSPWDWNPGPEVLQTVKALPKESRRLYMNSDKAQWNVYSTIRGLAPSARVSKENPPSALHGIAIDYDSRSTRDEVIAHLQQLEPNLRPQFLEQSIGDKWRLVWVFEKPLLVGSLDHAEAAIKAFVKALGAENLLAGFDPASLRPTEVWTNGGIWFDVASKPLAWDFIFGIGCEVAKKASLYAQAEIPLEVIGAEVKKRFPNRWHGDFETGQLGVRFWDEKADCPTGCQVKPEGMLCFTGNIPFVRWVDIFGPSWCNEQRAVNLGKAASDVVFDGKVYYEPVGDNKWVTVQRADMMLTLKNRGLSDKAPRGQTVSDCERVLHHIQTNSRVDGVAPLINYKPGLVELSGRKILNTARLRHIAYPADATGDPAQFAWLWDFFHNGFRAPADGGIHPKHNFFGWLQRGHRSIRYHQRLMGQVLFICGPANTGKTLLSLRVIGPMMGDRQANPSSYFHGHTEFTDELFEAPLLAMNDEAAAKSEAERSKFLSRVKEFAVNPKHTYHPKFCARLEIDWVGRVVATLNDDPASTGLLPEVNDATRDKMMFFAMAERTEPFPDNVEEIIERELPYFAYWLDKKYEMPAEIRTSDRMGVKSYYDQTVLECAQTQLFSYNLIELLSTWVSSCWEPERKEWVGTPTDLHGQLSLNDNLTASLRDWSTVKLAKSLTAAARLKNSGVEALKDNVRGFRITPEVTKHRINE